MDVTPLVPTGRRIIDAYGEGGFRISGERHRGSLIVLPDQVLAWKATTWPEVELYPLLPILIDSGIDLPELILLGTGERMIMPGQALRREFRARGIGLEAMDTGAACRTYNVLLAEGRKIAAALIAVA